MRIFILLLLLSVSAVAQTSLIKGRVLSMDTKKPLPYVNMVLTSRSLGASANKDGFYALQVPDSIMNEKIRLTYLGFQPKEVTLNSLAKGLVYLSPKTEELSEVFVGKIQRNTRYTQKPDWSLQTIGIGNLNGGLYPSVLARKIEKPEKFQDICFLEELTIYFYQTSDQKGIAPKFRLHFYEVAENGEPGDEIPGGKLLTKASGKSRMRLDLLKEKIRIPKEGIFIGLEHLFIKENQFSEVKDYIINDSLVATNYKTTKYAPIYLGSLQPRFYDNAIYYYEPGGWVRIENWDLSAKFFGNKIPSPVFKLKFTD